LATSAFNDMVEQVVYSAKYPHASWNQTLPGAARSSQEQSRAIKKIVRSSQEQPGAARRAARSSQEQPEAARSSQK
jgi:hypothetical protein